MRDRLTVLLEWSEFPLSHRGEEAVGEFRIVGMIDEFDLTWVAHLIHEEGYIDGLADIATGQISGFDHFDRPGNRIELSHGGEGRRGENRAGDESAEDKFETVHTMNAARRRGRFKFLEFAYLVLCQGRLQEPGTGLKVTKSFC